MGVYIGMEMPENCAECAFCGYYGNGEHMCDIIQKAVGYESAKTSRLDACPLIPAADVRPVRHGRWESSRPDAPMFGFLFCSLCGRKRTSPQDNYCPNCGAMMEKS